MTYNEVPGNDIPPGTIEPGGFWQANGNYITSGKFLVLYVDDEPDLLEIGKLFLEHIGDFSIGTIDSATAALGLIKSEQFDAIISDYQMPGMDGIEFLKRVRSSGNTIPFILFTGKGREEVVIQALNEGADFYLQKGGDPTSQFAELSHKVKQAISNKMAGEALKKSEEKYRHLIEHANEAIVVAQDGLLKLVNYKATEMTGYSEQELLSMPLSAVIHPDDRVMVMDRYKERLNGGELPARYPFRVKSKLGDTWWVEISAVLIEWDGRLATLNFLTDITERKAAEDELRNAYAELENRVQQRTADLNATNLKLQKEIDTRFKIETALLESQEGFRTLIEKAPEAIFLFDVNQDRYIDVNEKAVQLFGCSRQQLLDSGPQQFYTTEQPDGRPLCESVREHRKQLSPGKELIFERHIRNAGGEDLIVEVRLIQMHSFNKTLNRSSFIDITDRRKKEEELRQLTDRLSLATRAGGVGIWDYDVVNNTLTWDDQMFALYGIRREQFEGIFEAWQAGLQPDDWKKGNDEIQMALRGEKEFDTEFRILWPDGSTRTIRAIALVQRDASGKPLHMIGTSWDITVHKEAEATLQQQTKALTILNEIVTAANKADDLPHLIRGILDESMRLLDFDAGAIYLVNPSTRTAGIVYSQNLPPEFLDETRTIPIEKKPYNTLFIENKPIITGNYAQFSPERAKKFGFLSLASIPLLSKRAVIGSLNVVSLRRHGITAEEKQILLSIGRELGNTIDRVIAEEEAKKARNNLETLFNSIDEMVFVLDMQGNIITVNKTVTKRLLYTGDELTGKNVLLLHVPERRDEALAVVQGMIAGTIVSCPVPIIARDGTRIEVETKVTRGWWNNQEVLIGVSRDVTERKLAEEALRHSEEKFRDIFNNTSDAITIHDMQGRFIEVNDVICSRLGYSRQELLMMSPLDIDAPEYTVFVDERIRELERSGLTVFETVHRAKGGTCIPTEVSARLITYDGQPAVISNGRDITERKRAEEALRLSEERYREIIEKDYRSILENIQDVFYRSDINGNLIMISPSGATLLGYAETDEMTGKPITDFYMDPSQRELILCALKKDQSVSNMQIMLKRKDGSPVAAAISSHLYFDSCGNYAGVEGVLRDITTQTRAEETLRASHDQLAKSEAELLIHKAELEAQTEELMAAQLALGESRDKYLELYEFAPLGYLTLTSKALIEEANLTAATLLGVERRKLLNARFGKFVTETENDRWYLCFRQLLYQMEKQVCTLMLRRGDGSVFPARLEGVRIADGNTGNTRVKVIISDITDIREAEKALRESEEKFRLLTEKTNDIIYSMDLAGNITYISPQISRYGFTPEEIISGGLQSVILAEDLPRVLEDALVTASTGNPTVIIFRIRDKSGGIFWMEDNGTAVYDASGKVVAISGIVRDITSRRQVDDSLHESE